MCLVVGVVCKLKVSCRGEKSNNSTKCGISTIRKEFMMEISEMVMRYEEEFYLNSTV